MIRHKAVSFVVLVAIFGVFSCDVFSPSEGKAKVINKGEKIFIEDLTGKQWDVTHAVNEYGFRADQFQHGIGPFAIRPINDPKMVGPGGIGYPGDNEQFLIVGTTIDGDSRAYPLNVLRSHEIANEKFGNKCYAIGY
jgi:hypothetical protein